MATTMNNGNTKGSVYYFHVDVREGAPGCADDDYYKSHAYGTFEDAYKALVLFDPRRKWRHFRMVQRQMIWREGGEKVNVYGDGCAIQLTDLPKLGVTEKQLDDVIESIDGRLPDHDESEDDQ